MHINSLSRVMRAALAVGVVTTLGACADRDPVTSVAPREDLQVGLRVSSSTAPVGAKIAVGIEATTSAMLGGIEGHVKYDHSALRYVGQQSAAGEFLIVKSSSTDIDAVSFDPNGLGQHTGVLVFEVTRANYALSLDYEFEQAATLGRAGSRVLHMATKLGTQLDNTLAPVSDAAPISMMEHLRHAYVVSGLDAATALRKAGTKVQLSPGQYLAGLKYGDVDFDGQVLVGDAVRLIDIFLGTRELITGTDSPSADYVIAGNVVPAGTPPGIEADGSRKIDLSDAVAVINAFVFPGSEATAGKPVPGREATVGARTRAFITDSIKADRTLFKDTVYQLNGLIYVANGATLTIQAGTRIEGDSGVCTVLGGGTGNNQCSVKPGSLIVTPNGRINAVGTVSEPIVFSCNVRAANKYKGCWGGLVLAGNAPVNDRINSAVVPTFSSANGTRTDAGCYLSQLEGITPSAPQVSYGGCNPADSSGALKYVVVEFGGFVESAGKELNGLTLAGIGNRTTVDYVQVHGGLDDGVEIFGGTVDVSHLWITSASDDGFDTSQGWIGRAQFIAVLSDPTDGDKCHEVDNVEHLTGTGIIPGITYAQKQPWGTYAEVWNYTCIGRRSTDPVGSVVNNSVNSALHYRRGAKEILRNGLVFGYNAGAGQIDPDNGGAAVLAFVRMDQNQTCDIDAAAGTGPGGTQDAKLQISNTTFVGADQVSLNFLTGGNVITSCRGEPGATGAAIIAAFLTDAAQNPGNSFPAATTNPFGGASAATSTAWDKAVPDIRPNNSFSQANAATPVSKFLTFVNNGAPAGGATGPTAGFTRSEFFDASAVYVGAVAPATLAKNNIPWYSGWTRPNNLSRYYP